MPAREISFSINEKKLERSPENGRTRYKLANGVTASAQLRFLYCDKIRPFNKFQLAFYRNFIINRLIIFFAAFYHSKSLYIGGGISR